MCRELAYLRAQIFWSTGMHFCLITMAGEQVETLEQIYTELPKLVGLPTCHLHTSNLKLLDHLSSHLDYSLNVVNIFLSRCEELNIPETLTTKIRRFLEELYSIHTSLILLYMISRQIQMNHPLFPQPNQYTQDLGCHDLEF